MSYIFRPKPFIDKKGEKIKLKDIKIEKFWTNQIGQTCVCFGGIEDENNNIGNIQEQIQDSWNEKDFLFDYLKTIRKK